MGFGVTELLLIPLMLAISGIPFAIWAAVDALGHTQAEWNAIGESRPVWLLLIVGGTLFGGIIGLIYSGIYLVRTRAKLQAAAAAA